jgi:hypothetical protein
MAPGESGPPPRTTSGIEPPCSTASLASELIDPDAFRCAGIVFHERHACLARIRRKPRPWTKTSYGPVEWLCEDAIAGELEALLPRGAVKLRIADVDELKNWFDKDGKFPAVHIATGKVGA